MGHQLLELALPGERLCGFHALRIESSERTAVKCLAQHADELLTWGESDEPGSVPASEFALDSLHGCAHDRLSGGQIFIEFQRTHSPRNIVDLERTDAHVES